MNVSVSLTVAERIALTLDLLCRAVAARVAGGGMAEGMILLVWQRVRRIDRQIQGLLARFLAGRLRVRGSVPATVARGRRAGGSAVLPRAFGWLLPLVPSDAAGYAGQLRAALQAPEMVALLVAAPQARRVLAPLCRMLGIEASVLAPVGAAPVRVAASAGVLPGSGDAPRREGRSIDVSVERVEALGARLE